MDQKNIEKIKLLEQENELLKQKLSNYTNSPAYKCSNVKKFIS